MTERGWHKSSYSQNEDAQCVEVTTVASEVAVRDSKAREQPALRVRADRWIRFVAATAGQVSAT